MEQTFTRQREALAATPAGTDAERRVLNERLQLLDREQAGERLRGSFAGILGQSLEPVIRPLGFDWKIGIGIVASFAAREVFVSTMSLVYNVGEIQDKEAGMQSLAQTMQEQKDKDGKSLYRPRVALALMVFYVFALQCISTVAVVRRETNGWKWPLFQWIYMGVLAWTLAWVTYQVCPWFGLL